MANHGMEKVKTLKTVQSQCASVEFEWEPNCPPDSVRSTGQKFVLSVSDDLMISINLKYNVYFKYEHQLSYEFESGKVPPELVKTLWTATSSLPGMRQAKSSKGFQDCNIITLFPKTSFIPQDIKVHVSLRLEFCQEPKRKRFWQGIESLRTSEALADVVLSCEGKEFACHKFVLAAHSPVFRGMLTGIFKEAKQGKVVIDDMTSTELELLLGCLYSKDKNCLKDHAERLLQISDKYDIQDLKEECEAVLMERLNKENMLAMFALANTNNAKMLKEAATDFIRANKAIFNEKPMFKALLLKDAHLSTGLWLSLQDNDVISKSLSLKEVLLKDARLATEMVFDRLNS